MHGAHVPCMGHFVCAELQASPRAVIPSAEPVLSVVGDAMKLGRGTAWLLLLPPAACAQVNCSPGVGSWASFTI